MTLLGTIGFIFLALGFGFYGFMLSVFGGSAVANKREIGKVGLWCLTLSMLLLPASGVIAAIALWYAYSHEFAAIYYSLSAIPALAILLYIALLFSIIGFR